MPDLLTPPVQAAAKEPSRFFTEYYSAAFLFLIAVFVIGALFVLRPIIDDIKQTNADTQVELQTGQNQRAYLDSLNTSIAAAQTISPDVLARVAEALPTTSDVPALLVQFGSAAYANGIKIDSLAFNDSALTAKPIAGTTTNPVVPIDITLQIHAPSYFDIKRFLADVETSLRIMDVLGMSSGGGGTGDVFYSLQLRAYAFRPPATVAAK